MHQYWLPRFSVSTGAWRGRPKGATGPGVSLKAKSVVLFWSCGTMYLSYYAPFVSDQYNISGCHIRRRGTQKLADVGNVRLSCVVCVSVRVRGNSSSLLLRLPWTFSSKPSDMSEYVTSTEHTDHVINLGAIRSTSTYQSVVKDSAKQCRGTAAESVCIAVSDATRRTRAARNASKKASSAVESVSSASSME